jgi:serine protease Do
VPVESNRHKITARKGEEHWQITLKPHSPLATHLSASYSFNGTPDRDRIRQLRTLISSYTAKENVMGDVPDEVLYQKRYAVCIEAGTNDTPIRFSGFIVGSDGLIIATAHDLDTVRNVVVSLHNGKKLKGRVVRMDFDRDLSLIDTGVKMHSSISLSGARDLLETGERVYSIACTGNSKSTIYRGIINRPPGRVNNLPLWQVDMKTPHGASGGPVFDAEGSLVGVVRGRYRGTESKGFLITAETIIDFLKDE